MAGGYFNYNAQIAENRWDCGGFVRRWWGIYAGDRRWAPPYYPRLRRTLAGRDDPFLARWNPILVALEAMPGKRRTSVDGTMEFNQPNALMEVAVGATVLLCDSRRRDGMAYLGLLRCVNDAESLERLLGVALEQAAMQGRYRLIGPTGLSPHLGSGVLQDHFHLAPPLHTAYNPPYAPEVMESVLTPILTQRLFHATTPPEAPPEHDPAHDPAQLVRMDPADFDAQLAPLLAAAFVADGDFPAPDVEEAAFLLRWAAAWPLEAWVAQVDGQPAGYIVLQPDLSAAAARAGGGKGLLWRLWLNWRSARPVTAGRLLWGGVLPQFRGRGVGRQLWQHALAVAREAGWRTLSAGPLSPAHPAAQFLAAQGAQPQQTYKIYATET